MYIVIIIFELLLFELFGRGYFDAVVFVILVIIDYRMEFFSENVPISTIKSLGFSSRDDVQNVSR